MIDLEKRIEDLINNASELHLIGDLAGELSRRATEIEDGFKFFRSLLAKLLGENILQNFVEDDSLSGEQLTNLDASVLNYAKMLNSLAVDNGFREHAAEFGRLYRDLLVNKQPPNAVAVDGVSYYQGTKERPVIMNCPAASSGVSTKV